MEGRYSYDTEGPAPCNICGSVVYEQMVPGDRRLGGASGPPRIKRLCRNPDCPSNTGVGLRLTQAV